MESPTLYKQEELQESSSTSTSSSTEHPLHPPAIFVQDESEQDSTFVDDRTFLDDQGRPNISRTPSVIIETDSNTSHTKVKLSFCLLKKKN